MTVSVQVGEVKAGSTGVSATADRVGQPVFDRLFASGPFEANCPSRIVLDHITSRWGVLILAALTDRTLRWGELRRRVEGISEKMLAQTLKTFERDGLVRREARPVIPPHVEYSLTARGDELVTLLLPLLGWVKVNAAEIIGHD